MHHGRGPSDLPADAGQTHGDVQSRRRSAERRRQGAAHDLPVLPVRRDRHHHGHAVPGDGPRRLFPAHVYPAPAVNLEIDISTGDKVTPRELKYNYPLLFEDKTILINSYNIETILSEKIETILKRGKFNSRMKDFYDVYFFINNLKNEIDVDILKKAIENTFTKRDSFDYLNDYEEIILSIKGSDRIKKLWQSYSSKYKYANNISIETILDILLMFINELDINVVAV